MRQFYTLPALKIVLRLNKNKESIKSCFGIVVTYAWHTLLKLSQNTIKVFDTLQKIVTRCRFHVVVVIQRGN